MESLLQAAEVWLKRRSTSEKGAPAPKGFSVLFSGPSGTGKTMAAGTLAARLGLPLVRVDLSRVVSKYIGETEKNLADIFENAERAGHVLLFDEADALFGKRTKVADSGDRYANQLTGFLLQKIEDHGGIVVLTSNRRGTIDDALLRRFTVAVELSDDDGGAL